MSLFCADLEPVNSKDCVKDTYLRGTPSLRSCSSPRSFSTKGIAKENVFQFLSAPVQSNPFHYRHGETSFACMETGRSPTGCE